MKANRDFDPSMRAYMIDLLEAGHRGALESLEVNERYAAQNAASDNHSEEPFDFASEAESCRELARQYAMDLESIRA